MSQPGTIGGVALRGSLYVAIAVLTPLAACVGETALYGYWPPVVALASAALTGLVSGLVALRAFLDGSVERLK